MTNKIDVLDHGYVELVDFMGSDERIVQAARVSTQTDTKGEKDNRRLIRYMMRNQHWSPFEQCEVVFCMKLPIFVARQFIRHRTFSYNECSARYSQLKSEFYLPDHERLTKQSTTNKQGSAKELVDDPHYTRDLVQTTCENSLREYEDFISEDDLTRELARIVMPVGTYTQWYMKADLRNLFNFLKLRLDENAQYEARVYAQAIEELVKPLFPLAYEAFEDYILGAHTFSKQEMEMLQSLLLINVEDTEYEHDLKTDMEGFTKDIRNDFYKNKISNRELEVFFKALKLGE